MKRFLAIATALFIAVHGLASGSATAQELVTDISDRIVELRHDFTGEDLLLFGTIGSAPAGVDHVDVAISVLGPSEPIRVRRKSQVAGIWVNSASVLIDEAPGYYALVTTRPLASLAPMPVLKSLELGPDFLPLKVIGSDETESVSAFKRGFQRNLGRQGLFHIAEGSITFIEETLFRADIRLPANVPEGLFKARVSLFYDGQFVSSRDMEIRVGKIGFERAIYTFAQSEPMLYGLAAVIIALIAGWLASFLSRR